MLILSHFHSFLCLQKFIHKRILFKDSSSFLITCVYAFIEAKERLALWNSLKGLAKGIDSPQLVMGDFNVIIYSKDKHGGSSPSISKLVDLKKCVNICSLYDLPCMCLSFTWSNQQVDSPFSSKIHRVMCSMAWLDMCLGLSIALLPYFPLITLLWLLN